MYVLIKSDGPLQAPTAADESLQADASAATAEPQRADASTAAEPGADTGGPAAVEDQTDDNNLGNDLNYPIEEFDDTDDDDNSFTDIVAYYLCKRNFLVSAI